MDLLSLRSRTEALTLDVMRSRLAADAGLVAAPAFAEAFRGTEELLARDSMTLVREARSDAALRKESKRGRRLDAIRLQLWRLTALAMSTGAHASISQLCADRSITGLEPGERLNLHESIRALSRAGGRDARAGLASRIEQAAADLDDHGARTIDALHRGAVHTGFASPVDALSTALGCDVAALADEASRFLSDTADMYGDVLAWWLRKTVDLKPFPHGASHHDLAYAFGPPAHEGVFPRTDAATLLKQLHSIGIDDSRVRIDLVDLAARRPLAFAAAVEVPGDVRVVARPGRGLVDAWHFLRAWGTSLHLAHTDPARPFEDRIAGDLAVATASGELFADLALDQGWLKRGLDVEGPDLVRTFALWRLSQLRLCAARMLHARDLLSDGVRAGSSDRFAELCSTALLARHPPEGFASFDPLDAIDSLRASMLTASLFEHVRDRYDDDWWRNPRTGTFLHKRFTLGGFETTEQIVTGLDGTTPSLTRWTQRLERLLV